MGVPHVIDPDDARGMMTLENNGMEEVWFGSPPLSSEDSWMSPTSSAHTKIPFFSLVAGPLLHMQFPWPGEGELANIACALKPAKDWGPLNCSEIPFAGCACSAAARLQ